MTVHFAGIDTPTEPLGVGTWAWGDSATWGMGSYDTTVDESTIAAAWESSPSTPASHCSTPPRSTATERASGSSGGCSKPTPHDGPAS